MRELPNDILLSIADFLPKSKTVKFPLICKGTHSAYKDIAYYKYRVDWTYSMRDLHNMINHNEGIEEITVDHCDIFFLTQLTLPRLKVMNIHNCRLNQCSLDMYKDVNIQLFNCDVTV